MRRRWYQRYLWPRLLYWSCLLLLVGGLLLATVGDSEGTVDEDRGAREAGAAIGLIALAGVLGGKYWMDYVTRGLTLVRCPACGRANHCSATFCSACGAQVRMTIGATSTPEGS